MKAGDLILIKATPLNRPPTRVFVPESVTRVYHIPSFLDVLVDTPAVILKEAIDTDKMWYTCLIDGGKYMVDVHDIVVLPL